MNESEGGSTYSGRLPIAETNQRQSYAAGTEVGRSGPDVWTGNCVLGACFASLARILMTLPPEATHRSHAKSSFGVVGGERFTERFGCQSLGKSHPVRLRGVGLSVVKSFISNVSA